MPGPTYDELRRRLAELEAQFAAPGAGILETTYRRLFDASPFGIFIADAATAILEVNSRALALLGYRKEELIGKRGQDLVHPEDQRKVPLSATLESLAAGETVTRERRFRTAGGGYLHVAVNVHRVPAEHAPVHHLVMFQDLSDRDRAARETAQTQRMLDFAIEQIPIPVIIASPPDVTITHFNRAAEELLVRRPDDLRSVPLSAHREHWPTFYPDGTPYRVEDLPLTRAVQRGETTRDAQIIVRREDGDHWVLANAAPLRDETGRVLAGIVAFPDITGQKRAEEELRESEQRLRTYVDHAPIGIFVADARGRYQEVNPAACAMTGYTREQLLRMAIPDLLPPHGVQEGLAHFQRVSQEGFARGEIEFVRRNGSPYFLSVEAVALPGDQFIAFCTDVTGRRRGEQERERMAAQLQQAMKMEALGTLSGGIAHDFNNILGIIVGNTELALGDIPSWSPAADNMKEVLKATLRARDMVRQILAFSRQTTHEKKPLGMTPLIRESVKMLRATLPSTIEIREQLNARSDTVSADPTQIHQVMINLCTNAAHAMRERGGILEVGLEDREKGPEPGPDQPAPSAAGWVVLTVSDTGHGIEPSVRERIFDPYFTTKDVGEGTGMGLSVVHGIVRDHGGAVRVESAPRQGARFEIFLPRTGQRAEPAPQGGASLPRGSERVLLVDDEQALADLGRQMLEHLGYRVTTAASGVKALELFRAGPARFDLVVTDMTMPLLTGADLCRELRRIRADVPLVLCTGYSDLVSKDEAARIGIGAFVSKPLSLRELAETVRRVLDGHGT